MRTLAFAIMACAALALPHAMRAATFTVDSTRDDNDVAPGDGVCATAAHDCTLRAAIREANALAGADTITLPAGRFPLSIRGANEDAGMTGDLDITDDLDINGAGESATIIDGNWIDRVFDVHSPAHVTLSGLTITDGKPPDDPNGGGGMLNDGSVTLIHVTLLRNRAGPEGWGGGLTNFGTATLAHVTLLANRAPDSDLYTFAGGAGGMWNVGTATLTDVTFRANRAGDGIRGGQGGDAGGLFNEGPATLTDVTFSLNRAGDGSKRFETDAGGNGGGMFNDDTVTLTRVTFDRNRAGNGSTSGITGVNSGGGLYSEMGTVTLNDVVFVRNRAGGDGSPTGESGGGGSGGGVWSAGSVTLTNVTFDQNRAGGARGRDSLGGFGGGLEADGAATLTNVTVTRNRAGKGGDGGWGGGLVLDGATLTNVTLANNRAGGAMHGGEPGQGHQIAGDPSTRLTNTIVLGPGNSCNVEFGSVVSLGHNIDSGTSCGFAAAGDLSNTDPRLEPTGRYGDLPNHGGFTPTLALLPGSPAIDAGDNAACPATDQRGVTRPQGAACDIGAYEFQP